MRINCNSPASDRAIPKGVDRHCPPQPWLSFPVVFGIAALLMGFATSVALATSSPSNVREQMGGTVPPGPIWTRWHPNQYALAEDGEALWIGAASSIVRWDKASKTQQRFTGVDGLPHQPVDAVAIDAAGNRWFGGDGGLSRLATDDSWTHFTTANSGLASNLVDGIAVGADNTLWVSHGLPEGRVSQRDPDGTWHVYQNRSDAVVAAGSLTCPI